MSNTTVDGMELRSCAGCGVSFLPVHGDKQRFHDGLCRRATLRQRKEAQAQAYRQRVARDNSRPRCRCGEPRLHSGERTYATCGRQECVETMRRDA